MSHPNPGRHGGTSNSVVSSATLIGTFSQICRLLFFFFFFRFSVCLSFLRFRLGFSAAAVSSVSGRTHELRNALSFPTHFNGCEHERSKINKNGSPDFAKVNFFGGTLNNNQTPLYQVVSCCPSVSLPLWAARV